MRVAVFVVPFVTAMVVAYALSTALPGMSSTAGTVLRWLGIVVVATVAMRVAEHYARRLLPLSTLLELTLVFPDQAPSRFSIAMRTGTTKHLARRIEAAREGRDGETPAEAAERLLELVGLLSHHDRLTRGHSERVRAYTHLLGTELGLTKTELDKIRWAGLLHDVGKTAIPAEILNKPGRLTDEEYATIQTHPEVGRSLVAPLEGWLGESLRAVWEHHEKFDGSGYPRGLQGAEISIAARIVAVADVYDVMTSARSYKKPMPAAEARQELIRCSGTHFDPIVVRAFLNISLGRLRLMAGPMAWLAQFTLFEPTGVVHAGGSAGSASSAAAGSSVAGTAGAGTSSIPSIFATASSGAASSAAAATTAGGVSIASVLSGAAVVTMGVASGATGVALSQPDPAPVDAVVVEAAPFADAAVEEVQMTMSAPGATAAAPATSVVAPVEAAVASGSLGGGESAGTRTTVASASDDVEPSTDENVVVAERDDERNDEPDAEPDSERGNEPDDEPDDENDRGAETTPVPSPTTLPPTGPVGDETTEVQGPPSSTPGGNVPGPPVSTPGGNVPGPPTTIPPTTIPPTTTPPTTVPQSEIVAEAEAAMSWYLRAPAFDSVALPVYLLSTSAPTASGLVNLDVGHDDVPGMVVEPTADGVDGSEVVRFAKLLTADEGRIKADLVVDVSVAPKNFTGEQVTVQAAFWHCPVLKKCKEVGVGTSTVVDAREWTPVSIELGSANLKLSAGDIFELRIAALDSSETDLWLAFGTTDHVGALRFVER